MKLATLADGTRDGTLVMVSSDGSRFISAAEAAPNLQSALERWGQVVPALEALAARLAAGQGERLDTQTLAAPLPRAWQWLDGSAYPTHGELMQIAFGMDPLPAERPLMYQGLSHQFLSASDDVPMTDEALGIDFEGEFGVITDAVPMGIDAADALAHIRLIVQINDWSLRTLAPIEMKTGFGWIQAKPACSVAPFAVTPNELGEAWRNGRVCVPLKIEWNGRRFGEANGEEMAFGFHDLIAHAARTRSLPAGTIVGSGTVSNAACREVGSSCISERRAIEMIDRGAPATAFMAFGDRIRMEARTDDDRPLFGAIDQRIVSA